MTGQPSAGLVPHGLRRAYRVEPMGIDEPAPPLSWRLRSDRRGDSPARHRELVSSQDGTVVYDSGELADPAAVSAHHTGTALRARMVADDEPEVVFEPRLTYHGFRATASVHVPNGGSRRVRESEIPAAEAAGSWSPAPTPARSPAG